MCAYGAKLQPRQADQRGDPSDLVRFTDDDIPWFIIFPGVSMEKVEETRVEYTFWRTF